MGVFSAFHDKKKQNTSETPTVETHYIKLGRKVASLRYIVLAFVVAFAVYSLSFHSDEITIENFRYMLKFINLGEEAETPEGGVITFDGSAGNKGIIFKGDLAVMNESGLTITGWDSEILLKSDFMFDHPKMVQNGINLFCYDIGGNDIKVFNSYSRVWSPETPFAYPIYGLAASQKGGFAVITSEKGYRSAVHVYDSAFRLIYSRLFGDDYVNYLDINKDGNEFIAAAHFSEKGNLVTRISRFKTDAEEAVSTSTFVGEIPLGVYYTENGYALMTSEALRFFDNDGNTVGTIDFNGKELLSGRIYGKYALVTYGLNGLSGGAQAVVYDLNGNTVLEKQFPSALSDTSIAGGKLYALSPGVLSETDVESGKEIIYSVPTSFTSIVRDDNRIILFSENRAEYFESKNFERQDSLQ